MAGSDASSFFARNLQLLGFDRHTCNGTFRSVVELVDNAVDAVSESGSAVRVVIRQDADGSCVDITATDNGRGLSAASAASLSGTFFVSTKGNLSAQIGTYGVGLKAVALWSHVEAQRMGLDSRLHSTQAAASASGACESVRSSRHLRCGDIFLSSQSASSPRTTLLVRASKSDADGIAGARVKLDVFSAPVSSSSASGCGTVVTTKVPCAQFAALCKRLRAYAAALSCLSRSHTLQIVVIDATGATVHDLSPPKTARIGQLLRVNSDIQLHQSTAPLSPARPAAGCHSPLPIDASKESVAVSVALQFASRDGHAAAASTASFDACSATQAAPRIPVTVLRLVNGAPLLGGSAECSLAQAVAALPWDQWGLTPSGVASVGDASASLSCDDQFDAELLCLRSVGDSAAGCRPVALLPLGADAALVEPVSASSSCHYPKWAFHDANSSWLVGVRIVISLTGSIGTYDTGRSAVASRASAPVPIQFQSLRKRSLVHSLRLDRAVHAAAVGAMHKARASFPALLRSSLHRSHAKIFDTLLPGLSSAALAVCRGMRGDHKQRLLRLLHLDGQPSVTMEQVKVELVDALERFAQAMIHVEDKAKAGAKPKRGALSTPEAEAAAASPSSAAEDDDTQRRYSTIV